MGRPPKSRNPKKDLLICNCGNDNEKEFYKSNSVFYKGTGKIPYCKKCVENLYKYYVNKYKEENCTFPEKKAIQRLCMAFDVYYNDNMFNSVVKGLEKNPNISLIANYMRTARLSQYTNKSYDNTLDELEFSKDKLIDTYTNLDGKRKVSDKTVKFFGAGFSDGDYEFLQEQYNDWTTRHECQTKTQEEVFKQICFTQLELLKARRSKQDTKDLNATLMKQLEVANLQPKQNTKDTVSDSQTFGTLIDKWENERPLPEIDENLKDVDRIGWYIDVFFRGHLSKMMGIKNAFSNLYTKAISKYTVQKPEYDGDDNSEVIFDAIFGKKIDEE